nr:MAG TPA: hypothetical protein [Caudoviricetes sp.]
MENYCYKRTSTQEKFKQKGKKLASVNQERDGASKGEWETENMRKSIS